MPCKIQIKSTLTSDIMAKSKPGLSMSLNRARALERTINSEYKTTVVRFRQAGDFIDRDVMVPNALVDRYYEYEKKLEIAEARKVQQDDAERAGEDYDDQYLFYQVEGLETGEINTDKMGWVQRELVDPLRRAIRARFIESRKDNMLILSTMELLLQKNPDNYTYLGNDGKLHLSVQDLYYDIKQELGDDIIPKDTLEEIKKFSDDINNPKNHQRHVKNRRDSLKEVIGKGKMSLRLLDFVIKGDNLNKKFHALINNSIYVYEQTGKIGRQFRLKAPNGEIYSYYFKDGELARVSKRYTKEENGMQLEGFDQITEEDDEIMSQLALQNFKSSEERLNKALEVLHVKVINENIKRAEEELADPEAEKKWVEESIEYQREMMQYGEEDIAEHGVIRLIEDVLIGNNIINEEAEFVRPLGFTADGLLDMKQDIAYRELSERQAKIQEILNNKEEYNNEFDEFEEDGFLAAPMPGWFINAVSVANTGKLMDEHTGIAAFMVRGVQHMDAQRQYDAMMDEGATPSFQELADTTDLNSLLPQGISFGKKSNMMSNIAMLNQTSNTQMTHASEDTIKKVKEVAEKMGFSIIGLKDYLKGNPNVPKTGINALTDLVKKVIAIAEGKEAQAITEEMVHVATAILEQTNPELITSLISKIGGYKIYKRTFNEYKGLKAYQLSNGKPNIRKIKKEAVDKLIAELIVNESPDVNGNPELVEKTTIEKIKQWWRDILSVLRGRYKETNTNIFQDTASIIMSGDISGTATPLSSKEVYYQLEESKPVNDAYDKFMDKHKDLKLYTPEEDGVEKRHYKFRGKDVAISVTEKIKKEYKGAEREGLDKILDESKRDWGSEGHEYIDKYITTNLIDENGYALPTPKNEAIATNIPAKPKKIVENFAKDLIASYPKGTRFLTETKVVNEDVPGMMASAIDFIAIVPTQRNNKPDVYIDMLDWKFTSIDKNRTDDIPFFKQKEWKQQMGEYSRIAVNYGFTGRQIKKARMIPFIMNYGYKNQKNPKEGFKVKSVEVGDINDVRKTKLYLLPVPLDTETTGFEPIDKLVSGLRAEYKRIYSTVVSDEDKAKKNIELNEMSKAIRLLHMKLEFSPLYSVAETFLKNARKVVDSFKGIDYSNMNEVELRERLKEIQDIKNSAEKYQDISLAFKLVMDKNNTEDNVLLTKLARVDSASQSLQEEIGKIHAEFAMQLGVIMGLTTQDTREDVLAPEKEIDKLSKSFLEMSKLPSNIIKMGADLIMRVKSLTNIEYNQKMNEFQKIIIPLERLAASQGKKAFDMIAKTTKQGVQLVKKLDSEFIKQVQEARITQDKEFLRKQMDDKKYQKLLKKTLDDNIAAIKARTWFPLDEEADNKKKEYEIKRLKDRVDISRDTFNGWKTPHFGYLFYNSINEEDHYSPQFKAIKSNPTVLKAWEFFTELNKTAESLGYLEGSASSSFLPLIEATAIEKLNQTDNIYKQSKDLFADLYTVRINEQQNYAKIDEETGLIQRKIPKYFTVTDKPVNQLSTNLEMMGAMWIKAILDYKAAKNLEYSLLTLHEVEKAKHNLAVANGGIIFRKGEPLDKDEENKNADFFKVIIDDAVYFIKEDLNSWGAQKVDAVGSLTTSSKEGAEQVAFSIKKGVKSADVLFRSLAIGLKPLIGIANYFGLQFQSFINSGTFYKFSEFKKWHYSIMANSLTKEQKAIIHLTVPLNEDIIQEKRRDIARDKGSAIKWLSTWTFTDVMMSTNSFPERLLQLSNAAAMNDNSMVVDGKIVNIRQHVAAEDRKVKYNMSVAERKKLESTFEQRVKDLKATKSLTKVVKIDDNGDISIPGVDNKALADYRLSVVEYGRKLSGLMSEDNKMGYRRDTILSSFMMFKSWIPKHVTTRAVDIHQNLALNQWEYGKTRLFAKVVITLGMRRIGTIRDIIEGNEKGLQFLNEMLEKKKRAHFNKTGKNLTITQEEFYDLVRQELKNQMKELALLVGITAVVVKINAMEPPEDATDKEKNQYKWFAKMFNKTYDEIMFYYNPLSFDSMTRGSIMPSIQLLGKVVRAFSQLYKETEGHIIGDEEMIDKAHPLKYFLNLVPGAAQFQNEVLPYVHPELAKEMGIRVTTQNRQH